MQIYIETTFPIIQNDILHTNALNMLFKNIDIKIIRENVARMFFQFIFVLKHINETVRRILFRDKIKFRPIRERTKISFRFIQIKNSIKFIYKETGEKNKTKRISFRYNTNIFSPHLFAIYKANVIRLVLNFKFRFIYVVFFFLIVFGYLYVDMTRCCCKCSVGI